MGSCPSFEHGLLRVLGAFDALFQGVFKTVPVGDMNASMLFAKIMIWPDNDILIVQISLDFVVWSSGKGVCMVCSPRFVFEYDIVLLPFREVSCDMWPDFVGVAVVSEVCMVGVDYDGDGSPFEQMGPAAESSHDPQEFPIVN
jgi:hypothetical protein